MTRFSLFVIVALFLVASCDIKDHKQMGSYTLKNGQQVKWETLSEKEYNILKKDAQVGPLEEIKRRSNLDAYILKDGKVLVNEKNFYALYDNLGDLNKIVLDAFSAPLSREILQDINFAASDFPSKTDSLIEDIKIQLNVPDGASDGNLIAKIDQKISKLKDSQSFKEKHVLHFIALIGEALIKKHNAKWNMELASDGKTWNPYLNINGHKVNFFVYLYEDIFMYRKQDKDLLFEIYDTVNAIKEINLK